MDDTGGNGVRVAFALLLAAWWCACGQESAQQTESPADAVAQAHSAGFAVDTVGVLDLTEADTLNLDRGLTMVETTITMPPESDGGEVWAWEFMARSLRPVKLIVVRFDQQKEQFELVGESGVVVPRQIGANFFRLREPIPIRYRDMFGIIQPEEGVIPFRKVFNWKAMVTARPFERPLMRRDRFGVYGWRYAVRVFWRRQQEANP